MEWLPRYVSAISRYRAELGPKTVRSIYFGGGTPSLMPGPLVDGILQGIQKHWPLANDLEVTLEANPSSVETSRFTDFFKAGVNRVSLGIQALNDDDLKKLGRLHTADEALRAWETACKIFERTSFDLIYARQQQSLEQWEAELGRALQIQNGHLSLYQLTIEPNTAFSARFHAGKLIGLPDDGLSADMFELTQEMTQAAGVRSYEISNHAEPELESRHNLIYWNGGDYLGIGPGAHGRISIADKRFATEADLIPANWLKRVDKSGIGECRRDLISNEDQLSEYLMMSLRTTHGAKIDNLQSLGFSMQRSNSLIDFGAMEVVGGFLRTTDQGRPLLNEILRQILT